MKIKFLDNEFSVVKLNADTIFPTWALESTFLTYSKTPHELSIVCESSCIPDENDFIDVSSSWSCFYIEGILDFSMTGILSKLSGILADNNISLFAISTFDTDYILVKTEVSSKTKEILSAAGYCLI